MKNLFVFFLTIVVAFVSNAQEKPVAQLLLTPINKQNLKMKIISCNSRINENALFIIDQVPYFLNSKDTINSQKYISELISPKDIASISFLKGSKAIENYGSQAKDGVVFITTKKFKNKISYIKTYTYKTYEVYNENWTLIQDVYNDIQAKVPNVSISRTADLNATPNISMRGDDNTIVIVDGIRYDASIFNTLNPADIESITVAPSAAATTYLRNN